MMDATAMKEKVGPEHQVGERIDPSAPDVVVLEDLGDLDHARGEEAHEEGGDRDEGDGVRCR